jgi:hypothetical protein
MDKASERKKDYKECGDTDIGVKTIGPDNVRAQLDGLWDPAPEKVVGLPLDRLMTNCYRKDIPGEKKDDPSIIDQIIESGPPFANVSKPLRVL